jgi:hypothetical protein
MADEFGGECRSRTCPTFRSRRVSTAMPCRSANSPKPCDRAHPAKREAGWLGRQGSNLQPAESESAAPPIAPLPTSATGPKPRCVSDRPLIADVIVPLAAVEAAGAQAAFLETAVPSRKGTSRCARASRSAPCRRARRGRRAAPGFPRRNPRLRLCEVSKGRQLVEVVASHGTLLWLGSQNGQGGRIRTCDRLVPSQERCRAALRPVSDDGGRMSVVLSVVCLPSSVV